MDRTDMRIATWLYGHPVRSYHPVKNGGIYCRHWGEWIISSTPDYSKVIDDIFKKLYYESKTIMITNMYGKNDDYYVELRKRGTDIMTYSVNACLSTALKDALNQLIVLEGSRV